jgi:hypothetical protein
MSGHLYRISYLHWTAKGNKKDKKGKKGKISGFFALFASTYYSLRALIFTMYPEAGRFGALTGASPRPYTPRFAHARRFFTVGNKESF